MLAEKFRRQGYAEEPPDGAPDDIEAEIARHLAAGRDPLAEMSRDG